MRPATALEEVGGGAPPPSEDSRLAACGFRGLLVRIGGLAGLVALARGGLVGRVALARVGGLDALAALARVVGLAALGWLATSGVYSTRWMFFLATPATDGDDFRGEAQLVLGLFLSRSGACCW